MTLSPDERRRIDTLLADWLAQLGGERREASDPAFQAWLAERSEHRRAYERFREARMMAGSTTLTAPPLHASRAVRAVTPKGWTLGLAVAATLVLAFAAVLVSRPRLGTPTPRGTVIATNNELRLIDLDAGDAIAIDRHATLSRDGAYSRSARLLAGRARFGIGGSHPDFTVVAGDLRIVARNAVFDIETHGGTVTVTILDGRVSIERPRHARLTLAAFQRLDIASAGERQTTIARDEAGWTVALLPLDGRTLGEVAAMTRHRNGPQILLADPGLAALPLQGQLRVDNVGALARQLAAALELDVEKRGPDFVLRRRD